MSHRTSNNDQTYAGVFLIGLAFLFITGYWWPGIMFVIGIAGIVRSVRAGAAWNDDRGAVGVLAVGVVFALLDVVGDLNFAGGVWPIILIGLGVYLLFGKNLHIGSRSLDKSKHDDLV